ncbi:hypothetical protein SAMN05428942_7289 [Streptomyces sp. 2112.2]|uniref:hypothetical protein n=1 Tax=Streptomyces sp. 2112.2 TaxID=1881024 RepID=UPI00089983A6|nr:hypothetical protein [Streptomyces sp. 2112.2]SEF16491.1 hypothetical protein SAMN05428942_7289 [Streptomyces sp. 2112.2]
MTRHTLAAVTVVAALALSACSVDGAQDDNAHPASPDRPTATGTGPYPDPAESAADASPLPAGKSGQPHGGIPSPGDVRQTDATEVTRGALTAMWTSDTTLDTTQQDATRRAARAGWLTPTYAAQLTKYQPHAAPGAEWAQWSRHRAYTTVHVQDTPDAGQPGDTDTTAYRQITLTVTPHGRDKWTGQPATYAVFVVLSRADKGRPWRLSATTVQ